MKFYFVLPIFIFILLPIKLQASTPSKLNSVCKSFTAGELDGLEALETLEINIYDYSIGVNNAAKILCS